MNFCTCLNKTKAFCRNRIRRWEESLIFLPIDINEVFNIIVRRIEILYKYVNLVLDIYRCNLPK